MISRRQLLRNSAVALAATAAPTLAQAKPAKQPNILLCIADDVSWRHLGAHGCSWVKSPAFDRVAKEGLLFNRAYTPNAKCAPSRACVLTGRNSWQLEEGANHWCHFPAKFKSYPEALSENGYFVGYTGKGYGPAIVKTVDGKPRDLLVRRYAKRTAKPPARGMSACDYAANFNDFLKARPKDKPFCFWYGGHEPHRGYEFKAGIKYGGKKLTDIDAVPKFWPDNDTVRTDMLDYAFEIEHFDKHLGKMLKLLEAAGELENTLIVVTSDNGMPFPRVKGQAYEYSNHLPMAIRWGAGIAKPGRAIDDFVSFIDLAPTFLDFAGVKGSGGMQSMPGKSLREIFESSKAGLVNAKNDHTLIGKELHDVGRPGDVGYPIRGIVKGKFLYVKNFKPSRWPIGNPEAGYPNTDGSPTKTVCLKSRTQPGQEFFWAMNFGKRPAEELYQIDTDAECLRNLAGDPHYASIKAKLEAQMMEELTAQKDPRALGKGDVFESYPYANARSRNYYERITNGKCKAGGWINASDVEPLPSNKTRKKPAKKK